MDGVNSRMAEGGLSPRMRGNRDVAKADESTRGSIPAHAGEPGRGHTLLGAKRVYPRACGGTMKGLGNVLVESGLSPRMRGNPERRQRGQHQEGSIPAHAGEPQRLARQQAARRVYPRACGGTEEAPGRMLPGLGLSPRMRGNLLRCCARDITPGSIPAHAGEPGGDRGPQQRHRVYPRACGGTIADTAHRFRTPGLSPRMRGNQHGQRFVKPSYGSIPAHAGEPCGDWLGWDIDRVYPRACGGTEGVVRPRITKAGLSPRMRGNQHGRPDRRR